jgi:2,4-dienoyl-CoA reductase-like NADH-dependent reductase (Old Yellow Enzyme family)
MSRVFQETTLAGLKLRNRIIRSATHDEGTTTEDGFPTEELEKLYIRLAKGGVGAIITGYVGVQQDGKACNNMRMFDHDRYMDHYKNLNLKLKEYETPLILQVAHGGGQTSSVITGGEIVAPSRLKYPLSANTARELSDTEIRIIINNFVKAIERAKTAGFDGVQLHAAHGYLLSEFLSPHMNRRKDSWGGSLENRFRIIKEIIECAREKVNKFPILMKFCAYDGDRNGMRIEESIQIASLFQKAGGDAIEVSSGGIRDGFSSVRVRETPLKAMFTLIPQLSNMSSLKKSIFKFIIPLGLKKQSQLYNFNVKAAEKIKSEVDIPVIVVGGIRKLEDINEIINQNKADFISMCRPFVIEPDIVNKFASEKQNESRCIDCGYCLFGVSSQQLKCYYGKLPAQ